jgi:putative CocE/NonD family hydrolase
MGPWYHGQWAGNDGTHLGNIKFDSNTSIWYQNNIEIPFFNYYLKGKGDDPELPEATIFFSGENKWHQFNQWPPVNTQATSLFFAPAGTLTWDMPNTGKSNNYSEYISDPAHPVPYTEDVHFSRTREYMTDDQRFASRRPDVLTFQTDVLNEDLTIAGVVTADLKISMSGTDADFVVKVIDVFPDDFSYPDDILQAGKSAGGSYLMGGYQMLVRGEIMRGKFRNSFAYPVPFKPGKIETVKFDLPDVAHTFQKGHRLMIQVQSTWFPLADRNPQQFENIYEAKPGDFKKATIRLYHNGNYSSSVILPVLKK